MAEKRVDPQEGRGNRSEREVPQEACVPYQESACRLHPWGQGSGATGAQRKARNERDKLHQKERVEEGNGSVPDGRDGREKGQPLRDLALGSLPIGAKQKASTKPQQQHTDCSLTSSRQRFDV